MSYPTIDQPTEDLDEQGLPYQRADAPLAAFGGRTAQEIGDARDLLALGAQQYRRQLMQHQLLAHESAANDALNQYRLQGDDLWRQYGGTRQREAVEGHDAYQQGLQASRAQAQQGLSAASQALLREALHHEHQDRVQLGEAHRAVQDQAWSDQSSLDTLGINKQAAVLHRDDPARVQALAQRGDGEWLKLGERRGWSDRRIGDQVRAWRGQVYGAVIDRQLHEGNIGGAGALLARVQGELDPPTATELGGRIVLANARIQDQRNAPVAVPDDARDGGIDSIGAGDSGDQPYGGDGKDTLTDDASEGVQLAQIQPTDSVTGQATMSNISRDDAANAGNISGEDTDYKIEGEVAKNPSGKPKSPAANGNWNFSAIDHANAANIVNDTMSGKLGNLNWNILDIKRTSEARTNPWLGSGSSEGGFETFTAPEYGARAAYRQLPKTLQYIFDSVYYNPDNIFRDMPPAAKEQLTKFTIANLAHGLLDLGDNDGPEKKKEREECEKKTGKPCRDDAKQWIKNVVQHSGIGENEVIDINDLNKVAWLFHGIAMAERGENIPISTIISGIRMQKFGEPLPTISLDEARHRLEQIAIHAPKTHPTIRNPNIKDIRELIKQKLRDQTGSQDFH